MENVLIDTDIFIDNLRGYKPSTELLLGLFENYNVHFSAITEAELLSGKSCSGQEVENAVLDMLLQATKIEVDNWIARKAGEISRNYGINLSDALIAATAIKIGCTIYTRNVKDFSKVNGLKVKVPY